MFSQSVDDDNQVQGLCIIASEYLFKGKVTFRVMVLYFFFGLLILITSINYLAFSVGIF